MAERKVGTELTAVATTLRDDFRQIERRARSVSNDFYAEHEKHNRIGWKLHLLTKRKNFKTQFTVDQQKQIKTECTLRYVLTNAFCALGFETAHGRSPETNELRKCVVTLAKLEQLAPAGESQYVKI